MAEVLDRVPHQVDPATFPAITVGQDVSDFDHTMAGPGAQELVLTLAENLELENQALLREDATHPDRGRPRRPARRDAGPARGRPWRRATTTIDRYDFDTVTMSLLVPFGKQDGLSVGIRLDAAR